MSAMGEINKEIKGIILNAVLFLKLLRMVTPKGTHDCEGGV